MAISDKERRLFLHCTSNGGTDMRTTILAYVIAFLGLLMIGGGIWDLLDLLRHRLRHRARAQIPIRDYGMAIGTICVGVGIGGIAQALRLLVAIAHTIQPH
jgi:uncharacterized membrane protein YidH (DUF202 family)